MNGWLRFTMRDFLALAAVRESLFTTPKSMPASTALCISGVPRDSAEMVYESIAFVPSSDTGLRKEVRGSVAATTPSYVSAVRGGPLVFTCGEVPIDQETPKAIKSFEDLSDAGRFLPYGRIHDESGYQARAWFIYNQNRSYL